ncbi:MAG: hypothetical protein AAF762_10455 [Pseudomonadota bacterium]
MPKSHRIAGLKISRVPSRATPPDNGFWSPLDALPDLEPPDDRLRRQKRQIFASDSISLSRDGGTEDVFENERAEEPVTGMARASVYASNLVLMVMSPPIGIAMLLLNIIRGENLRMTLQLIAITGFLTALATTTDAAWLQALV